LLFRYLRSFHREFYMKTNSGDPNRQQRHLNPKERPSKTTHSRDFARFKTVQTSGMGIGVGRLQNQVLRARIGAAIFEPTWEGSTGRSLIGSMMATPRAGCKRDRRALLHGSPHPGTSDVVERTLRGSPA
jgi:hypothetical protein